MVKKRYIRVCGYIYEDIKGERKWNCRKWRLDGIKEVILMEMSCQRVYENNNEWFMSVKI